MRGSYTIIAIVLSITMGLKIILVGLEMRNKRLYLKEPYSQLPRETLSGIISLGFYWWLASIFVQGFRTRITLDSLGGIDSAIESEQIQCRIQEKWNSCKWTLAFILMPQAHSR